MKTDIQQHTEGADGILPGIIPKEKNPQRKALSVSFAEEVSVQVLPAPKGVHTFSKCRINQRKIGFAINAVVLPFSLLILMVSCDVFLAKTNTFSVEKTIADAFANIQPSWFGTLTATGIVLVSLGLCVVSLIDIWKTSMGRGAALKSSLWLPCCKQQEDYPADTEASGPESSGLLDSGVVNTVTSIAIT